MLIFMSLNGKAEVVSSTEENVAPSTVDRIVPLVNKSTGSSAKKLSIVLEDKGMGTGIEPRYVIYLGYASMAEMGNLNMDFKITDQAYKFVSASRKSAGIYEVKTIEYDGDNMMQATYMINAIQMFADEDVFRRQCNDSCPEKMQSRITVTKTVKKLN